MSRTPDQALRSELIALAREDLRVREELVATGELFDGYHPRMEQVHKGNAGRLKEIVDQHGWPGRSIAGDDGANAAWLILYHDIGEPEFMRACLPMICLAALHAELRLVQAAMLVDRIRFYEGNPPIYGTNYDWDETGQISPTPIEDPARVDGLRKSAGLSPLGVDIIAKRKLLLEENANPPLDINAYRRQAEEWYQRVGWRTR